MRRRGAHVHGEGIPSGNASVVASTSTGTYRVVSTTASPPSWRIQPTSSTGRLSTNVVGEPAPNDFRVDGRPNSMSRGVSPR